MLTGQKVIDVHASKVVSLAGVQTTAVDFKTKVVYQCVWYCFRSANITFNLDLDHQIL